MSRIIIFILFYNIIFIYKIQARFHNNITIKNPIKQINNTIINCNNYIVKNPNITDDDDDEEEEEYVKKCPLTSIQNLKKISIELIRYEILRKLHMDENNLPNITLNDFPISPTYLNEFINIQNDIPYDYFDDDEMERTEKIIAFSKMSPVFNGKEIRSAAYFTFSDKLLNMKIESAMLHIHIKYQPNNIYARKWPEYRIKIFEIISQKKGESIVSIANGPYKPYNQQQQTRTIQRTKWIQIDIRELLIKWVEKMNTDRKIGFVIEPVDLRDNPSGDINVVMSTNELDVSIQNPFMEIKLTENSRPRPPRHIGMDCDESSMETRCCRFPLVIDFEEFGWDWIIAPKKYDANYCSGECPFAFLQKYPHNHIIQQAGIGGPCCAARKMSPITMLYFDRESNIVFSVLNGMVVDKCGCS